jgi:rhodanese-related sulfurtransferase
MKNLTEKEWQEAINGASNPIIIDVRTPGEWQEGAIPNSLFMNIMEQQSFVNKIEALDKSKDYFVYCRSGARSGQASNYMSQLGFANVYNLDGGIMDYSGNIETPTL